MYEDARPLRAGVIGCGFFAQNHLNAWQEIPEVELAAVCDVESERARKAAERFGVAAWYDNAESMLKETELDFVDVVTTPPSHPELVELAAQHQKPVICQKPIAFDRSDAESMVAACKQAGVPLMVHENFRWQTPIRAVRRKIDEGTIGRPFFGRISWRTGYDIFTNQPYLLEQPRLILADMGTHLIDLARFFFGDPQALVCHALHIHPSVRGEDAATILLEYDNATCIVDTTYSGRAAEELFPQTLVHIEGEEGTLDLEPHYVLAVGRRGGTVKREQLSIPQYSWSTPLWDVVQDSVVNLQRHWVDCLRTGKTPENNGEENLLTVQLVEGAYISAETQTIYRS
jgi:D-apiose dehydrogenase